MTKRTFRLPDVGEGLIEAEVVDWLVAVGDEVRTDQPIVTIETAKAQVELPTPFDGVVRELLYQPGDVAPVGAALFVIETAESAADETEQASGGGADNRTAEPLSPPAPRAVSGAVDDLTRSRPVLAAPTTRRFATEHGVDLRKVAGTGPNGRILRTDVESALAQATATSARINRTEPVSPVDSDTEDEVRPLRGLRRQVARSMTAAWSIPHITEFREIDATELNRTFLSLRGEAEALGVRITMLSVLIRAVVAALRQHPELNASVDIASEQVTVYRRIDIGIAAATSDGLIVPVLRRADRRGVVSIAHEIARLGKAARERTLLPEETTKSTFTVTNFGSYGTWLGTPLINAPRVAIAGFGRVRDAVVAENGAAVVRPVLPIAVSVDHRLIDGEKLAGFVATLERFVRNPVLLVGEVD